MTSAGSANASRERVIVVAVDESDFAEHAFLFYVTNIAKSGDFVLFAHVPEHQDLASSKVPGVDQLLKEVYAKAKVLEEYYMAKVEDLGINGKFEIVTTKGKPGEAIIKVSKRTDATLIVTGSRGQSKIWRAFLGSTSDYILHHSPVPVLVYRTAEDSRQ